MKKVKKYWMVVVQAGLLVATLVGVVAARPNDSGMGAISRRITIPAGHFIPTYYTWQWSNIGYYLGNMSGYADYSAPVVFPTGQAVVVESITLYAYDNDADDSVCAYLQRTDPTTGNQATMGTACSTGSSSTDPRSFTDSSISDNPVKHGKGVYLGLTVGDAGNLKAYGVRIQYHHGTT